MAVEDWAQLRARIVLWEDDSALVVDKPSGLSVMGERHDTDLVRIAADGGEPLRWVNRIDKVTSGAVVLAKTKDAHGWLTRQFALRSVDKAYLAICRPGGLPARGSIDLPLLTAGSGRVRVAAERADITHDPATGVFSVPESRLLRRRSFPSRTDYRTLWDGGETAVVLAEPVTGRRHQIRVHLAWAGHAIIGDPLFTRPGDPPEARTYLHSMRVAFETAAPGHGWVEVEATPGEQFWSPVAQRSDPADLLRRAAAALAESTPKAAPAAGAHARAAGGSTPSRPGRRRSAPRPGGSP